MSELKELRSPSFKAMVQRGRKRLIKTIMHYWALTFWMIGTAFEMFAAGFSASRHNYQVVALDLFFGIWFLGLVVLTLAFDRLEAEWTAWEKVIDAIEGVDDKLNKEKTDVKT